MSAPTVHKLRTYARRAMYHSIAPLLLQAADELAALEKTTERPHALQAVAEVRARYAEDIFGPPRPEAPVDCYSAAGARIACDSITRLLRGDA